jgi:hypothetical protein
MFQHGTVTRVLPIGSDCNAVGTRKISYPKSTFSSWSVLDLIGQSKMVLMLAGISIITSYWSIKQKRGIVMYPGITLKMKAWESGLAIVSVVHCVVRLFMPCHTQIM